MRKMRLFAVALMAFAATNASAQAVEEGNVLLDAYYGFPNLYTSAFKSLYANSGTEQNVKVNSLGPVGIRAEYLLSDKVGLGVDVGFNNTVITFDEKSYDPATGTDKTYTNTFSTQKIGAMITFNYHFLDNDNLDFYGIVGAGYGKRSFNFESTDPDYVNTDIDFGLPIASRIGVGLRYFFTDNIGANIALGLGQGGLLNAGLSFKF